MSDDMKIQGVVEMSSEKAEAALKRIGDKAEGMASRVREAGQKAGKAAEAVGDGADNGAEKFSRAEGRIVASIKRATSNLELLGKTASQKIEIKIAEKGLDASKFNPLLAKLRELEAAQSRVSGTGRGFSGALQNTSYQLQDFVTQVNGGTDATRALAMQLPQMLVGFGAAGAAVGVLAALLPNLIQAFADSTEGAKDFKTAMSDYDKAIGAVGEATKSFDMENLYEQFNKSSTVVQAATMEQLRFQQEFLKTSQMMAGKKFGESISDLGSYSTLDKLAGSLGSSGADKLASQLGLSADVARDLLPVIKGLQAGTEDVSNAFNRFGTRLLSGNAKARELASTMGDLAKTDRDAAAASTAISGALEKMANGHVRTKKEADAAKQSTNALLDILDRVNGKDVGLDASYWKDLQTLHKAYDSGSLSLDRYRDAVEKLTLQQDFAKKPEEEKRKALEEYGKAVEAMVGSLEAEALKLEVQLQTYGMTREEIERLTIARLEDARATAAAAGASEDALRVYEREIEARKRIASASSGIEVQKKSAEAAKKAEQDWERSSDNMSRSISDGLMRGFESGKSFSDVFLDTLKNAFATAVLQPIIKPIVDPVAKGMNEIGSDLAGWMKNIFGFAYGGVFGPVHAFAQGSAFQTNAILTQPTPFMFASGGAFRPAVAGEAGPEAVMPLTRDSSGRLGVQSVGGAAAPELTVQVINTGTPQQVTRTQSRFDGRAMLVEVFTQDMRDRGPMRQSIESLMGR